MFKVGVISDTHIHDFQQGFSFLENLVDRYFHDAGMILHAGDMVDPGILLAFGDRVVHVVRGNMDPPVNGIPDKKIIEVEGFRIGLIHGWGPPNTLEHKVINEFQGEVLDCLVYGHSHFPACHRKNGLLLFNPGSPVDRRRAPCHTVGILELGEEINGKIIDIGN